MPIYLPTSPTMSTARDFANTGAHDYMWPVPSIVKCGPQNLLRNGALESWEGATTVPDGWEWDSVGTLAKTSTAYYGEYAMEVTKVSTDGAVTRVWQSLKNAFTASNVQGKELTFSIYAKTDQGGGTIRPFVYDGTNYKYGLWYTADDEWQRIFVSHSFPAYGSAPTEVDVGVEIEETASTVDVEYYLDCAACHWGGIPYGWTEHYNDRSPICQDWLDQGTRDEVRGAMRVFPYQQDYTTVGGVGSEETFTVTLPYGCQKIIHASANLYGSTYAVYACQLRTMNYTTTSFDVGFSLTTGATISVGRTVNVTGSVWLIGWDDPAEQWG